MILTTTLPAGPIPLVRRPVWSDDIDSAVQELNLYITGLSQDGVYIFDAAALVNDAQYLDALHLKSEAYQTLNYHLEKQILRALHSKD